MIISIPKFGEFLLFIGLICNFFIPSAGLDYDFVGWLQLPALDRGSVLL